MKFRCPNDGTAGVENDPTTARFCGARVVGSEGSIPITCEIRVCITVEAAIRFWGKAKADVSGKFEVTNKVK